MIHLCVGNFTAALRSLYAGGSSETLFRSCVGTVSRLMDELTNGQDQVVRDFATQTLQVVNQHLEMARQLQATVSKSVASN